MSQDGVGCKDCKRVREHIASLSSIKVIEAASCMPLSISAVFGSIVNAFLAGKQQ